VLLGRVVLCCRAIAHDETLHQHKGRGCTVTVLFVVERVVVLVGRNARDET